MCGLFCLVPTSILSKAKTSFIAATTETTLKTKTKGWDGAATPASATHFGPKLTPIFKRGSDDVQVKGNSVRSKSTVSERVSHYKTSSSSFSSKMPHASNVRVALPVVARRGVGADVGRGVSAAGGAGHIGVASALGRAPRRAVTAAASSIVLEPDPLPSFVAPPGQPTGHVTVVPGPHLDGHQAWSPRSPVVALLLCASAPMTPQAKQAAAAERKTTFLIERRSWWFTAHGKKHTRRCITIEESH